jgi:hypothetical protein
MLGLSLRRFAAMTGVQYETARHWGGSRSGKPQEFPRWVPLMLEMMDPTVSQRPPDQAMRLGSQAQHFSPQRTSARRMRHVLARPQWAATQTRDDGRPHQTKRNCRPLRRVDLRSD